MILLKKNSKLRTHQKLDLRSKTTFWIILCINFFDRKNESSAFFFVTGLRLCINLLRNDFNDINFLEL